MHAARTLRGMGIELQDEVVAAYAAGTPVAEIERRYGVTQAEVEQVIGGESTSKQKSGRRWGVVTTALVAVALLAAAAAVGASALSGDQDGPPPAPPAAPTIVVSGSLVLTLPHFTWSSSSGTCWGDGGFADIRGGAPVAVTDAAGTVIAMSELRPGLPTVSGDRASECTFGITVIDVPAGGKFYGVEVSHRGAVRFAEADLGQVHLSLG